MKKIKIILVDDKPAYRKATKLLLNKIGNADVIAEASSGQEFLDIIEEKKADLVFMDIEMPGMNGIEATKLALEKQPDLIVIGLSLYDDKNYISELIDVGARGYLLKLSDNYAIIETILKYPRAEIFFSKEIDPNKAQKQHKNKDVIIIDDFANTRFIVEFTLKKDGYNVEQAENGAEALGKLDGRHFDLIITDLNMPGMDGITLSQKIRKIEEYKHTPILLLTTAHDQAMKNRAKAAGITGWIHKPFETGKFLTYVRKIVK